MPGNRNLRIGLPRILGSRQNSAAQNWQCLDVLFEGSAFVIAAVVITTVTLYSVDWADPLPWMIWEASTVLMLTARLALTVAYRRRSSSSDWSIWSDRFLLASLLTGIQWGLGAYCLYRLEDTELALPVLMALTAMIAACIARSYMHPAAALTQASTCSVMISAAYAMKGDWFLSLLILFYIGFQSMYIRSLTALKLKQLRSERDRDDLLERLESKASTDYLTGVANRGGFDSLLRHHWEASKRTSGDLALLMIDIDHFKMFNDTHGHQAGDQCLRQVADTLGRAVASDAVLARFGGEEFAVVLPGSTRREAEEQALRLIEAVRQMSVILSSGVECRLTISIGIACLNPTASGIEPTQLVGQADIALYAAKKAGRNCYMPSSTAPLSEVAA